MVIRIDTNSAFRQRGLTLVELMITLVILAILVAVGMPDFGARTDKRHLKGAAEMVQQGLREARSEAIKRNEQVRVTFSGVGTANWCFGMAEDGATCDCTANDCLIENVLRVRRSADLGDGRVTLSAVAFGGNAYTTFDPNHGTADVGDVQMQSGLGVNAKVRLSALGQVRVCSTAANTYGLETSDCN